ncbi:MAG TPA: hypothetical protein VK990_08535, partial [Acidimicrobiia bacterium]|nr:hypothetical protein [Acidimicrobiia bacterium]
MRWVRRILLGALVLAAAITMLLLVLIRRPFPQVAGELEVAGLDAGVDVVRDADGVPHIYAE